MRKRLGTPTRRSRAMIRSSRTNKPFTSNIYSTLRTICYPLVPNSKKPELPKFAVPYHSQFFSDIELIFLIFQSSIVSTYDAFV